MIRMRDWKILFFKFIIYNLLSCFLHTAAHAAAHAATADAAMINNENYYYDYTILDPQSAFGTPYGGWSRDTQSRIASLPLVLPPKQEHNDDDDKESNTESTTTKYMQVRDAHGQLYACRVYLEDELDPTSVAEGMFDPPRLRAVDASDETKGPHAVKDEQIILGSDNEANHETEATPTMDAILDLFAMNKLLHKLKGFCAHLHTGWWSYEWCYGKHVTQFHMSLENDRVRASDLTNLGKYSSRTIDTNLNKLPINQLAQGEEETARITETYTGGDVCSDTNTPRVATVTMVCCNQEVMAKHQSKYKAKSQQAAATGDDDDDSAALETVVHAVHESETCEYEIVVCTRLLCASSATANIDADATFRILSGAKDSPLAKTRPRNENESVREMLDRNLANVCIQTATTGWWTYEFCHGSRVRQFHIEFTTSKTVTELPFAAHVVASEHILGNFQQEQSESYLSEHEHKSVVNATATNRGADKGGNGAYFEVEYASGDVCDESEVTERAIVAGGVSSSGSKISRSSSVRYYCGHSFTLSVNEDSTCHYVVEVTVPDLCHHALFKAPAMVKQVVKCLPVDEENVI